MEVNAKYTTVSGGISMAYVFGDTRTCKEIKEVFCNTVLS